MTCVPVPPTFRLLDAYVGWDPRPKEGLQGLEGERDPAGLRLAGSRRQGQLLTRPIDSGIHRCAWHRVRAEATLPPGATLEIAVATAEERDAEAPHPLDWQVMIFAGSDTGGAGSLDSLDFLPDFLIDQPRGRYLHVRVRMSAGDQGAPILRRLRLDMPRVTSIVHLPAVYGEDPEAGDFTRRFLAIFDATVSSFDEAVERMPALLDSAHTPAPVLPWLARFFDIELDPAWTEAQRRAIIAAAPALYRLRGTPEGLRRAIELVLPGPWPADARPVVREPGRERPWGGIGVSSSLGAVRLFGRSRARLRLGTSTLGQTPIRSHGDPARDPIEAVAHRFEVHVPPLPGVDRADLARALERLVAAQKPAHTLGTVRVGGAAFAVGVTSMAGIDTVVGIDTAAPPPAPGAPGVLGTRGDHDGSIRLGRGGLLGSARRGPTTGFRVGYSAAGIHTALE